jgi:hypothetical protein
MTNFVDMADVCELAHILTMKELGYRAEKVSTKNGIVTVSYTKQGQEAFDYYYKTITETLNI